MKSFLCLFIFIILNFILSINGQCKNCFDLGERCVTSTYDSYYGTYKYTYGQCNYGLVCGPNNASTLSNPSRYVCRIYSKLNEKCYNYDSNCDVGLVCLNGICSNSRYSAIGEDCTNYNDCEKISSSSYCSIYNKCETSKCTSQIDCPYGSYCDTITSTCIKQSVIGQSCKVSFNNCLNGTCIRDNSYYSYDSGICTESILKKFGEYCTSTLECDNSENLYCSSNSQICEYYTSIIKPKNFNCTIPNSELTNLCDEFSVCNSCGDGKCYQNKLTPFQIFNTEKPLLDCMNSNSCKFVNNSYSISSCLSKNCGKEMCNYLKAKNSNRNPLNCGNTYFTDTYCNMVSSSSFSNFNNINLNFNVIIIIIISIIIIIICKF